MNLLRPELLCVIPCTQPRALNQSRSSSVFSTEENSVISPYICSERPSQEHDQPGRGTCSQTQLASSLGADPGMQHNPKSEKLCHQQCKDTSAGPGFPVNVINNPWLVLAQNDDKRAASVSPGRENHIRSTVEASVLSMSWRIDHIDQFEILFCIPIKSYTQINEMNAIFQVQNIIQTFSK